MDTRPCGVHIRASTEDFLADENLVHLRTNCHENGSDGLVLAKDLYQRDGSRWSAVTEVRDQFNSTRQGSTTDHKSRRTQCASYPFVGRICN